MFSARNTCARLNGPLSFPQRLVEAAEEAHHQHEDNPDLQVSFCQEQKKNIIYEKSQPAKTLTCEVKYE